MMKRHRRFLTSGLVLVGGLFVVAGFFFEKPLFATLDPPGPCTGGDDCDPVPHNENYSIIRYGDNVIGSWSIGNCLGQDDCLCNNKPGYAVTGVAMLPKTQGTATIDLDAEDIDYYYFEGGNEPPCPSLWDIMDQHKLEPGQVPVDLSIARTNPITGLVAEVDYDHFCKHDPYYKDPWLEDVAQVARSYVHVYEINLEAEPSDSVPMDINWEITPFTGSVEGDVTPKHLKVRVETADGSSFAEAGPYSGWSGSVEWDGQWMVPAGSEWDGCSQVQITLTLAPPPYPEAFGMTSIVVDDYECGEWRFSNVGLNTSILIPCPAQGGGPEIEICNSNPDIEYVCPGCCVILEARTCPLSESIIWNIEAGGYEDFINTFEDGKRIGICPDTDFPAAGKVDIHVVASLLNFPGETTERTITVWNPSPSWPCHGGIGSCRPDLTVLECEWLAKHPACAYQLIRRIRSNGMAWTRYYFPEGCQGGKDCTVGNAYLHAYVNCEMTALCSAQAGKGFWDLHEKKCPGQTTCNVSIMDLHNNAVGRSIAVPFTCDVAVWLALLEGNLIWSEKEDCCECDIACWESDYVPNGNCPQQLPCNTQPPVPCE